MCLKSPSPPKPSPLPARPTRADADINAAQKARRATADQTGVLGNIFTSVLGDSNYGTNAKVATLGGGGGNART